MGSSGKAGWTSSIRRGVVAAGVTAVQRTDMRNACPGSAWVAVKSCLGKERAPSSQAFRHKALAGCGSPSWPATTPVWLGETREACAASDHSAGAAWACVTRASSKQALATPETRANSHPSNTRNAVWRLVRLLKKSFMEVRVPKVHANGALRRRIDVHQRGWCPWVSDAGNPCKQSWTPRCSTGLDVTQAARHPVRCGCGPRSCMAVFTLT